MSTTRRSTPFLAAIGVLASGLTLAPAADAAPLSVVVATYNVRAAHLTAGDGGLAGGPVRMQRSLAHLEGTAVSVVALQELEKPAREVIVDDPDWAMYRANANTDSIPWDGGNAVMWRSAVWKQLGVQQMKVTYKDLDGSAKTLWMPVVELTHRATGESLTMVSIHNPGGPQRDAIRARVRAQEKVAIQELLKNRKHVVVAGDFNEVRPAACFFTDVPMKDATGYHANGGDCPATVPGSIDRLFGRDGLEFTRWDVDRAPLENGWSDHALVKAFVDLS